jgi:DNA repair exonuclease SbcCD nuclease subunit
MKIAHLADVHLGFRQYHRHTPTGVNQREADVANAFRCAVDTILVDQPAVVLIAGDFFHSVRPTNQAIIFAFQQLQRIRQALPESRVVLVAGNHDTPRSRETGGIISLFRELDVEVVAGEARRLEYPELDLSLLAVPYAAWLDEGRPELRPAGEARYQVLTMHAEVEGAFPSDSSRPEYGGALVHPTDIDASAWSYVALGHYHVQSQLAPNVWYSGALEYTSTNPWGELQDEAARGLGGKGWLLIDLETGAVSHRPIPTARTILDLPPIEGSDLSASELDRLIADRVHTLADGVQDKILRLVIRDVPRHIGRDLDHTAIRQYKADALHFQLDLRRPESRRTVGVGAPGTRQSLPEVVSDYLSRRPLPGEVDREEFVRLGTELVSSIPAGPTED